MNRRIRCLVMLTCKIVMLGHIPGSVLKSGGRYIRGKSNLLLHRHTTCECENSMSGDVVQL